MKQAKIYMYNTFAGVLTEDENGYKFEYDSDYLASKKAESISLTLPLTDKPYISNILHPFFDGLIPEGWLLDIVVNLNAFHRLRVGSFEVSFI